MEIRDTIFDSKSERRVYHSLISNWSPQYGIYPQIPISKIIGLSWNELDLFHKRFFPSLQRNYYYQAHTDYTLCDQLGRPLLTIEFDGMNRGFSRHSTYYSPDKCDPQRSLRLNFKLKLASLVKYPLIVISDEEVEPIFPEERLAILDSIVGSCIASKQFRIRMEEKLKELEKVADDTYVEEIFQDLVSDTEVETELDYDPIAREAADYCLRCFKKGISGYSQEYFDEPDLPPLRNELDFEGLRSRVEAMQRSNAVGYRIQVRTPSGPVIEEVLVRNFNAIGVDPLGIAENIAKYRAFRKALSLC